MNVIIVQIDNRPITTYDKSKQLAWPGGDNWHEEQQKFFDANRNALTHSYDYWSLTSVANRLAVEILSEEFSWDFFQYKRLVLPEGSDLHPSWLKWKKISDFLVSTVDSMPMNQAQHVVVVMLDSDAWICDTKRFEEHLRHFLYKTKASIWLSKETDHEVNWQMWMQYNGGFAAFRLSHYLFHQSLVNKMFLTRSYEWLSKYDTHWPMEQYGLNLVIREDPSIAEKILATDLSCANTPAGQVIRHCWWKGGILESTCKDDILAMTVKLLNLKNS